MLFLSGIQMLGQDRTLIKGTVTDALTGEPLTGATVYVKGESVNATAAGLDGSFQLYVSKKNTLIVCSLIGYIEQTVLFDGKELNIRLEENTETLSGAVVSSNYSGTRDAKPVEIVRNAANMVNVMGSRALELAPDLTVGNIIQRMSGVTVERNSSGEGQYAILRGMDKRYNYTLVNGIKIPSPDNKNRFVPLDLFPSEILSRIEVSKSMTADLEGDGIGGAVNLVMKDAPASRQLTANFSTGYNALYLNNPFLSFSTRDIAALSPDEIKGNIGSNRMTVEDFSNASLRIKESHPMPDINASVTYGDRFFKNKLGLLLSASYQNMHRGKDMTYYDYTKASGDIEQRFYYDHKQRLALHSKIDYPFTPEHKLMWYNGYLMMADDQVRTGTTDAGASLRKRHNLQQIFNSTLSGNHLFLDGVLTLDWKAVFSIAGNRTPDNAQIFLQGNHIQTNGAATRRWEHNSDRDLAGYVDLTYKASECWTVKAGALYRDKYRTSFFNEYSFDSGTGTGVYQEYGKDWTNFDEISIVPRAYGNVGDPLNYDASEKIAAMYASCNWEYGNVRLAAGVRAEHTDQGYLLRYPRNTDGNGDQRYWDILPDLHFKYMLSQKMNLHLSYAKAVNRPSFFEIVPYSIINEEYKEKGNPQLKHTVADNIDLRWEFFPQVSEQIMAGLFYKHMLNPIEYGLIAEGQDLYYTPLNLGTADNAGVEIDILKYFRWFGIKCNYTFTHSRIATEKRTMDGNDIITVTQVRPLSGQAAHVANLSLILNDVRHRFNAQFTGSYISKRLTEVSNWYENDIWENDYFRLELSAEKAFGKGIEIYLKASNLLDLPLIRFIQNGPHTSSVIDFPRYLGNILEREERYGQTVLIGIRYKLQ